MEKISKGFWDYVDRWREQDSAKKAVTWDKNWIANDYCKDCRYCCGPQDSAYPFPMSLLPEQIDANTAENFYLLDRRTACLGAAGCKSDTPQGCRLPLAKKPIACGLFPIVLVNGRLYLYKNCPAVVFSPLVRFMDLGLKAANMLIGYSLDDLFHLSLWLNCDTLARSYIDLRIKIFDQSGKGIVLD